LADGLAAHADPHGHGQAHHPNLQHHFQTLGQQHEAATLGMWVFLVTEVMFFGGLLMAYLLYRVWYPEAWSEGSRELDIVLGGVNTVVLIGSSLTMALGVRAAQTGAPKATVRWLLLTMVLGLTFLVIKFFEYKHKWDLNHIPGPGPDLYFTLFRSDRLARVAHGDRLRHPVGHSLDGAQKPIHAGVVHAGRAVGPVLALRGYRVDFPVPAFVPCGQGELT
jgi:hypothetical protein